MNHKTGSGGVRGRLETARAWVDRHLPAVNFLIYVYERGQRDQFLRVAASLSYTSLLALVPLLAIAVATFSAFPAFAGARGSLENFISQSMVPNAGQSVHIYLQQFINATGKLTTVGVVGLGVTAILMLTTIETAFNAIYRVAQPRPIVASVLVYWAVITLGPMLLGASLSISGSLTAYRDAIAGATPQSVSLLVRAMTSVVFSTLFFTVLFQMIPNRPVAWRDAAIGGAVSAVLFVALRNGFSQFLVNSDTYRTLYGALAVIPLFLVSMYLSWAVVLFGGVMTAALPEWRAKIVAAGAASGAGARLGMALDLLAVLREAQKAGDRVERSEFLMSVAAAEATLDLMMRDLHDCGFLVRDEHGQWLLARDLSETPMTRLLAALGIGWAGAGAVKLPPLWERVLGDAVATAAAAEDSAWRMPVLSVIDARMKQAA
jgi:membrane protein